MKTQRMLILIAARNLTQARGRSAFLATAIGLVTMLLTLLLSLSQGISENIIKSATTLTSGHVNVTGFYKSGATSGNVSPVVLDGPKLRKLVQAQTPGIDYIVDRHRGWASMISPTNSMGSLIVGVDIKNEAGLQSVLKLVTPRDRQGRPIKNAKRGDVGKLAEPNTIILFATQAERLEVKVGDNITLRTQNFNGKSNTIDLTVAGIAEDIGLLSNFSVFVPKQVILDLYQLRPETTGAVQIYLKDIDAAQDTMVRLRAVLEREGYTLMEYRPTPFFTKFNTARGEDWSGQKLDMTLWSDEVSFLTWILTALDSISFMLVAILVTIIAIGIMNTMWIAVRKRTGEIGTLRAIGMQRGQVLMLFLWEAAILGVVAATAGGLGGALVALTLDAAAIRVPIKAMRAILLSDTLHLSITAKHLVSSITALTLFTILAALWPATRAARLQPVEAIQQAE